VSRRRRRGYAPLAALLLATSVRAQAPPTQEPPIQRELPTPRSVYGPPQPEELIAVALSPDHYHRRNVVVRGYLEPIPGDYWLLSDGGGHLLFVPVPELSALALRESMGRRLEVTGIVRRLPDRQGTCRLGGRVVPATMCDDPALPPLPDRQPEWPPGSITATGFSAIEDYRAAERHRGASSIGDLLADPSARAGKTVRVVGRFRGANLFNDLPKATRRAADDWVLQDGERALWVTGRPPRGKGFDLDPNDKRETSRWLLVEGRLEATAGLVYLKASRVELVARPAPPREDKP